MSMKRRIGVITFYRYNYGGFLQAYALQRKLHAMGYDCELIQYDYMHDCCLLGISLIRMKHPMAFAKSMTVAILRGRRNRDHARSFARCVSEHLKESPRYGSARALRANPPVYDVYMTGSDQVFNPTINPQGFESRLLDFAARMPGKLVSYAASLGMVSIPDRYRQCFMKHLADFENISVREESARQAIAPLVKGKVARHIDPVMLLDTGTWRKFSKPNAQVPKSYIFAYTLLRMPEIADHANRLSRQTGLPIVALGSHERYEKAMYMDSYLAPDEFVALIDNADYIITSSFHCTIFSMLFRKKSRVYLPQKGSDRIRELIDCCGLNHMQDDEQWLNPDDQHFDTAEQYMKQERKRSIEFLSGL